jgi:hypothetical protein
MHAHNSQHKTFTKAIGRPEDLEIHLLSLQQLQNYTAILEAKY